jgi:hypothetical protein
MPSARSRAACTRLMALTRMPACSLRRSVAKPDEGRAPPSDRAGRVHIVTESLPLGRPPLGRQPLGRLPLGGLPLGRLPLERPPLERPPLGRQPLGRLPLGRMPLGRMPLGRPPHGRPPLGRPPLGRPPHGRPPLGRLPHGRLPHRRPPLARASSGCVSLVSYVACVRICMISLISRLYLNYPCNLENAHFY